MGLVLVLSSSGCVVTWLVFTIGAVRIVWLDCVRVFTVYCIVVVFSVCCCGMAIPGLYSAVRYSSVVLCCFVLGLDCLVLMLLIFI